MSLNIQQPTYRSHCQFDNDTSHDINQQYWRPQRQRRRASTSTLSSGGIAVNNSTTHNWQRPPQRRVSVDDIIGGGSNYHDQNNGSVENMRMTTRRKSINTVTMWPPPPPPPPPPSVHGKRSNHRGGRCSPALSTTTTTSSCILLPPPARRRGSDNLVALTSKHSSCSKKSTLSSSCSAIDTVPVSHEQLYPASPPRKPYPSDAPNQECMYYRPISTSRRRATETFDEIVNRADSTPRQRSGEPDKFESSQSNNTKNNGSPIVGKSVKRGSTGTSTTGSSSSASSSMPLDNSPIVTIKSSLKSLPRYKACKTKTQRSSWHESETVVTTTSTALSFDDDECENENEEQVIQRLINDSETHSLMTLRNNSLCDQVNNYLYELDVKASQGDNKSPAVQNQCESSMKSINDTSRKPQRRSSETDLSYSEFDSSSGPFSPSNLDEVPRQTTAKDSRRSSTLDVMKGSRQITEMDSRIASTSDVVKASSGKAHLAMTTRLHESRDRSRSHLTCHRRASAAKSPEQVLEVNDKRSKRSGDSFHSNGGKTVSRSASRSRSRTKSRSSREKAQGGEVVIHDGSTHLLTTSSINSMWDQVGNCMIELDYEEDAQNCYKNPSPIHRGIGGGRGGSGQLSNSANSSDAIRMAMAVLPTTSDEESSSEEEASQEIRTSMATLTARSNEEERRETPKSRRKTTKRQGSRGGNRRRREGKTNSKGNERGNIVYADKTTNVSNPPSLRSSSTGRGKTTRRRRKPIKEVLYSPSETAVLGPSDSLVDSLVDTYFSNLDEVPYLPTIEGRRSPSAFTNRRPSLRSTSTSRRPFKEDQFFSSETDLLRQPDSLVDTYSSKLDEAPYQTTTQGRRSPSALAKRRLSVDLGSSSRKPLKEDRFCSSETDLSGKSDILVDKYSSNLDRVAYETPDHSRRSTSALAKRRSSHQSTITTKRAVEEDRFCSSETDLLGRSGILIDPFSSISDEVPYKANIRVRRSTSALATRKSPEPSSTLASMVQHSEENEEEGRRKGQLSHVVGRRQSPSLQRHRSPSLHRNRSPSLRRHAMVAAGVLDASVSSYDRLSAQNNKSKNRLEEDNFKANMACDAVSFNRTTGRCHYHPTVCMATADITVAGGWRVVRTTCPKCVYNY